LRDEAADCSFLCVILAKDMIGRILRFWLTTAFISTCVLAAPGYATAAQHAVFPDVTPLFSDFDGDNKLDQAQLFSNGVHKSIHLSLGNSIWKALAFDSGVQDPGRLISGDIDSDGDADLIWVSQKSPKKFVMWLGDGRGNFSIVAGHRNDHPQARSMLEPDGQTRLTGDLDDDDVTIVLQTVTALRGSGSFLYYELHAVHCRIGSEPAIIPSRCISVLRKRGPPSHLS
jgi:hypothetical protein